MVLPCVKRGAQRGGFLALHDTGADEEEIAACTGRKKITPPPHAQQTTLFNRLEETCKGFGILPSKEEHFPVVANGRSDMGVSGRQARGDSPRSRLQCVLIFSCEPCQVN